MTDERPILHVLSSELTDKETYLIGKIVVGWGMLEFKIFEQTLDSYGDAAADSSKLPKAMDNMSFAGVLSLWEERVVGQASKERAKILREQLEEIRKLQPARNALVHGMWDYSDEDISIIRAVRIRKREVITFQFAAEDLVDFERRVAKLNFKVAYPGGAREWAEGYADEHGNVSYMSRRFLATITDNEIADEWQGAELDDDGRDSAFAYNRKSEEKLKWRASTDENSPFAKLMDILGKIGGVIGLASLAQNWFSDILAWRSFLAVVFESYRMITGAILQLLTGWLPFTVPLWVADYLLVGGVYLGSLRLVYAYGVGFLKSLRVVVMWPAMFGWTVYSAFSRRGPHDPSMEKAALQWMLTVFVGAALLLSINGLLPD